MTLLRGSPNRPSAYWPPSPLPSQLLSRATLPLVSCCFAAAGSRATHPHRVIQHPPPGEGAGLGGAGPETTKKVRIRTIPVISIPSSLDFPYGFPYCLSMASKAGHITLNFHPVFLESVRKYAAGHDMKVNAVFKRAFHLLQDHPELVTRKDDSSDFPY